MIFHSINDSPIWLHTLLLIWYLRTFLMAWCLLIWQLFAVGTLASYPGMIRFVIIALYASLSWFALSFAFFAILLFRYFNHIIWNDHVSWFFHWAFHFIVIVEPLRICLLSFSFSIELNFDSCLRICQLLRLIYFNFDIFFFEWFCWMISLVFCN